MSPLCDLASSAKDVATCGPTARFNVHLLRTCNVQHFSREAGMQCTLSYPPLLQATPLTPQNMRMKKAAGPSMTRSLQDMVLPGRAPCSGVTAVSTTTAIGRVRITNSAASKQGGGTFVGRCRLSTQCDRASLPPYHPPIAGTLDVCVSPNTCTLRASASASSVRSGWAAVAAASALPGTAAAGRCVRKCVGDDPACKSFCLIHACARNELAHCTASAVLVMTVPRVVCVHSGKHGACTPAACTPHWCMCLSILMPM